MRNQSKTQRKLKHKEEFFYVNIVEVTSTRWVSVRTEYYEQGTKFQSKNCVLITFKKKIGIVNFKSIYPFYNKQRLRVIH